MGFRVVCLAEALEGSDRNTRTELSFQGPHLERWSAELLSSKPDNDKATEKLKNLASGILGPVRIVTEPLDAHLKSTDTQNHCPLFTAE